MRDCADTAKAEIAVHLSIMLDELRRIYAKTRPGHKPQVQAEINKQLDHIKTLIARA